MTSREEQDAAVRRKLYEMLSAQTGVSVETIESITPDEWKKASRREYLRKKCERDPDLRELQTKIERVEVEVENLRRTAGRCSAAGQQELASILAASANAVELALRDEP
jgi:hypothetical protein